MDVWDYSAGNFGLLDDEVDKKTAADIDLLQYLVLDLGDDKHGDYAFYYSCPIVELKEVFADLLEKYDVRGEAILNAFDADVDHDHCDWKRVYAEVDELFQVIVSTIFKARK